MQLIASLIPTLIFLLVVLIGIVLLKKKINLDYVLLFIIAIGYSLLLNLPREYTAFQFVNSKWNWSGKIFALLFSILCVVFFKNKLPKHKVGLTTTFKQGSFKPALIFTICYLSIICIGSFFFQGKLPHSMDKQDILWNTTILPDFSEEFMERGILLVLLNNIFNKNWIFFRAKAGPGLIFICLLFGLEHGLFVNYLFKFTFLPFDFFRTVFVSALAFTWLKERTGNLIFPIIAHFGTEMILTIIIVLFL
jgi:membrane protease YdiL (CAAX protease family)